MVKTQKGFTLIELMIVIAIIGILAAVAVPQYGQYTKRAKFAEVISSTAAVKTAVSLCYQTTNRIQDCNGGAEGEPADDSVADVADIVSTLETSAGVITATGGDPVDNKVYVLDPGVVAADNGDPIEWSLNETLSSCDDAGVGLCRP